MNLFELKTAVFRAVECAADHGEQPEDIVVSLQIDDPDDLDDGYVCANDVTLHYDGNCNASGCVLQAWREPMDNERRHPMAVFEADGTVSRTKDELLLDLARNSIAQLEAAAEWVIAALRYDT